MLNKILPALPRVYKYNKLNKIPLKWQSKQVIKESRISDIIY